MKSGMKFAPVGSVLDITSSAKRYRESGSNFLVKPLDVCTRLNLESIHQIHYMKNYLSHIKKAGVMESQYRLEASNDEHGYVGIPYEALCIKNIWSPCLSDVMRAGFEDGKIRFEILGHRLGLVSPLQASDVLLDGHAVTGAHLLSLSSTSLSYYFDITEIPIDNYRKLQVSFR